MTIITPRPITRSRMTVPAIAAFRSSPEQASTVLGGQVRGHTAVRPGDLPRRPREGLHLADPAEIVGDDLAVVPQDNPVVAPPDHANHDDDRRDRDGGAEEIEQPRLRV